MRKAALGRWDWLWSVEGASDEENLEEMVYKRRTLGTDWTRREALQHLFGGI
jgi:hypothetical protein